jgi:VWFA-related protein
MISESVLTSRHARPALAVLALLLAIASGGPAAAPQAGGSPPGPLPAPQTAAPGSGQAPPSPALPATGQEAPKIRINVQEVIVPVTVKGRDGNTVLDLGRKDFRILEDDIEQQIVTFSNDPIPLSVILLVDDDMARRPAEMVDRSLGAVVGGLAPEDEMGVVLFSQYPRTVAELGSNTDKLHNLLKRTDLSSHMPGAPGAPMTSPPRTNSTPIEIGVPQSAKVTSRVSKDLDDAVYHAAQMLLERGRDRRKIILLVSDGRNSHNNTVSYKEVLRVLLTADISVYGIGVSDAVLDRSRSDIAKYAHATGGDAFYAASRPDLEENYSRVLEQARDRYTLTYTPRGTDRTKDYHAIEVRVERPGLTVLTREGYYALVIK